MAAKNLNFIDEGNGNTTLVFLHYFGGSSRTWLPVINALKHSYRCIAIDLPGFGDSIDLSDTFSVNYNAERVASLMEDLKLKNFILIAHSMGGKIALAIASFEKFVIDKIILVAPSPPSQEPMSEQDRNKLLSAYKNNTAIKEIIKNIAHTQLSDETANQLLADYFRIGEPAWNYWIEKGSRENIASQIKNNNSVLIISGEYDKNLSTDFLHKEFIKYFPDANFAEIKGVAHLIPVEASNELAKLVDAFLTSY